MSEAKWKDLPNRADKPLAASGADVYHLDLSVGDIPPYSILPGDPARTLRIAELWDESEELAFNREYRTVRGLYKGMPLATTSTGIGGPSSEICIHELNLLGVHSCIRVGTTGSIQPEIALGDLIIPVAAVRRDGSSEQYVPAEYPAFADHQVLNALMEACKSLGYRYHLGLSYTVGSFYLGQGRPISEAKDAYFPAHLEHLIRDLAAMRVSNIEMECAAQFVLAFLHKMRMGAVLAVVADRINNRFDSDAALAEEKACRVANEAMYILWKEDGSAAIQERTAL